MFNLVAVAGGAKNIANPEDPRDRAHVLFSIKKLLGEKPTILGCIDFRFWEAFLSAAEGMVRNGTALLLTTHEDCGAYGGSKEFHHNWSKELGFHRNQLKEAVRLVQARFGERGGAVPIDRFIDVSFNRYDGEHACEGMVFACGEAPFWQRAFGTAKSELGLKTFDILTTFGGAARMIGGETANFSDRLLRNIGISQSLHGIKRVVVAGHAGGVCGMTQEDVEKAAQLVGEKFPALRVEKIWSDRQCQY